jgi:hypothetical protein
MVQLSSQLGGRSIMKDAKDKPIESESKSYFEKIESANPVQAAQSVIANIILKIQKLQVD